MQLRYWQAEQQRNMKWYSGVWIGTYFNITRKMDANVPSTCTVSEVFQKQIQLIAEI